MWLLFLLLLSCTPTSNEVLEESEFENLWWGIEEIDKLPVLGKVEGELCFILIGKDKEAFIADDNEYYFLCDYEFEEPNTYHCSTFKVVVTKEGECWRLENLFHSFLACDCKSVTED